MADPSLELVRHEALWFEPSMDGLGAHDVGLARFLLLLREGFARDALRPERLERAIGVIYRPGTERLSHYFRASLPAQFDAVLHIDDTSALEPLERWAREEADLPETYPSGM